MREGKEIPQLQVGVKILCIYQGKFLLIKRSDSRYKNIEGTMWDIPGGRIDPVQTLQENLVRELYEEVGLQFLGKGNVMRKVLSAQDIWVQSTNTHVVRITVLGTVHGKVVLSPEHESYQLATLDEVLDIFSKDNLIGQVIREKKDEILLLLEHSQNVRQSLKS